MLASNPASILNQKLPPLGIPNRFRQNRSRSRSVQPLAPRITTMSFIKRPELLPQSEKYKNYDDMHRPIRVLGAGTWSASFEALALAQYQDRQEHWLS